MDPKRSADEGAERQRFQMAAKKFQMCACVDVRFFFLLVCFCFCFCFILPFFFPFFSPLKHQVNCTESKQNRKVLLYCHCYYCFA